MTISLYDISVAASLQIVGAVAQVLEKGKAHCDEQGIDLDEIVATQLYEDMLPFRFQIISVVHHSLGSINGIKAGEFRPPNDPNEYDYAGLQDLLKQSITALEAFGPDEVNAYEGKELIFKIGGNEIPFIAEAFVLSFSHPNLYFHATTAYDMLRMRGAPLGKRDFLGRMKINRQ